MIRDEALTVLDNFLAGYRARSYDDLLYLLHDVDTSEVVGPSGATYQIEVHAVWDGPENGDLRVLGSIDDGGLRAFFPLTRDFLVSPGGRLFGE